MLYGLLLTVFIVICFLLILLVLVQKGKGGMGIGTMGGGTQALFGGGGGQDFFQKTTWVLGALFMGGSLGLGLMKSSASHGLKFINIQEPTGPEKTAQQVIDQAKVVAEQAEPKPAQETQEQSQSESKPESTLENKPVAEQAPTVAVGQVSKQESNKQESRVAAKPEPKSVPDKIQAAQASTPVKSGSAKKA